MSENLFYLNHIHSALQYELQSKEKELATLPKGNLYTKPRKDGIHLCWSHQSSQNNTSKRQQKMLSEPYRSIAEGVQRQKFLNEQLPRIRNNLQLVDHCRTHYQLCDDTTIHSLLPTIYTAPLQYSGFETLSNFEAPSPTKPFYSEGLIHKNRIGQMFRSKAEVSISEVLRQMNISYQYEPPCSLETKRFIPTLKSIALVHPGRSILNISEWWAIRSIVPKWWRKSNSISNTATSPDSTFSFYMKAPDPDSIFTPFPKSLRGSFLRRAS